MSEIALTKYEQEVNLNFNMEDDVASLYTSSTKWIRNMDELCKNYPDAYKCVKESTVNGEVVGKTYEFPIKYFRLGKPRKELSDEYKATLKNRLADMRDVKNGK